MGFYKRIWIYSLGDADEDALREVSRIKQNIQNNEKNHNQPRRSFNLAGNSANGFPLIQATTGVAGETALALYDGILSLEKAFKMLKHLFEKERKKERKNKKVYGILLREVLRKEKN